MIGEYKANNGKFYIFFSDRIHVPDQEYKQPKSPDRFTEGNPCRICGNTKRYTANNRCVSCSLLRKARYREQNKNKEKHES